MGRSIALFSLRHFAAAIIGTAQAEVLINIDKSSQTLTGGPCDDFLAIFPGLRSRALGPPRSI
jgi:hypothetical protein